MKEFTIYFELFGKKMKTKVSALSEERAKSIVKDKIIFHKVEEVSVNNAEKSNPDNPFMYFFEDLIK